MSTKEPQGMNDLSPFVATLNHFGRKDLALEVVDEFAKRAQNYAQYDNVAKCYFDLKHYDKAMKYSEHTLTLAGSPQMAYVARTNLINVYNHANYPEKAMRYILQNEKVIPNDVDNQLEKAYSYFLLNEKDNAESILTHVLTTAPDLSDETTNKIKFNLGTYFLYRDKFQEGMRLFLEEGAKMKIWNTESIFARDNALKFDAENNRKGKNTYTKWDGKAYPGRPVILHAEAGIGDEIINVRFVDHIRKLGMRPYWFNSYNERKDLLEVFARNGVDTITSLTQIEESGEVFYAQSMHIPIVMGLEYEDLWHGPYLKADPEYVKGQAINVQKSNGRKKIAIRWQGNPAYDHDLHRSFRLKDLYEAVKHIDADFYSIQKDTGLDELKDFPGIIDMSGQLNSWEDTLGAIENMDFVITSCTSVLHAAAAIGKKTYAMIPISAYYVWSHSGSVSPWYGDHVTILRQQKPRTWADPLAELTKLTQ